VIATTTANDSPNNHDTSVTMSDQEGNGNVEPGTTLADPQLEPPKGSQHDANQDHDTTQDEPMADSSPCDETTMTAPGITASTTKTMNTTPTDEHPQDRELQLTTPDPATTTAEPTTTFDVETSSQEQVVQSQYVRPHFIVEESSDDDTEDAFTMLSKRKAETHPDDPTSSITGDDTSTTTRPTTMKKNKKLKIEIKLQGNAMASPGSATKKMTKMIVTDNDPVVADNTPRKSIPLGRFAVPSERMSSDSGDYYYYSTNTDLLHEAHLTEEAAAAEEALEQSLAFYADTHEDQDPQVQVMLKAKEMRTCQQQLEALAREDDAGRKEIAEIVQLQLKEKQESANRNIERLRAKSQSEEQNDMQKLLQMYNEKSTSNQTKIQHGIKLLSRRHTQEIHKQAQQHRLNAQQRGIPEQMAKNEWAQMAQQLQEKHGRQLQEFNGKGEEVKAKCEQDSRENETNVGSITISDGRIWSLECRKS
jgi:hypothetical protein